MAIYKSTHNYAGINQDVSKDKFNPNFYYDANNIRIISTDSQTTGAITNDKGNSKVLSILSIDNINSGTISYTVDINGVSTPKTLSYTSPNTELESLDVANNNHVILSIIEADDFVILLSTNNNGVDGVWKVTSGTSWDIELLYLRDLNFNIDNQIEGLFNFENEDIQKIYFTDNNNQLRHINIVEDGLINKSSSLINIVGGFLPGNINVTDFQSGGRHTSGVIQYAYNLYDINGTATKLSTLSSLVPLGRDLGSGGGAVNEVVGQINQLQVSNIDQRYDVIRLYAIKYNSLNELPIISLIAEESITSSTLSFSDDGSVINNLSVEEFLFLGGDPITAKSITTKDNRLFALNIKEFNFDVDLDTRAYSYKDESISTEFRWRLQLTGNPNINEVFLSQSDLNTFLNTIPSNHDAINPNFDEFNRHYTTNRIGGVGLYVNYELIEFNESQLPDQVENLLFLKGGEIYRIGIRFFNTLGQTSLPKWIGDVKAPRGNLEGKYFALRVSINGTGRSLLEAQDVVGWEILRAERAPSDKSIITQGLFQPTVYQELNNISNEDRNRGNLYDATNVKYTNTFVRTLDNYVEPLGSRYNNRSMIINSMNNYSLVGTVRDRTDSQFPITELYLDRDGAPDRKQITFQNTKLIQMYSPEVLFNDNLSLGNNYNFTIQGTYNTQNNKCEARDFFIDNRELKHNIVNENGLNTYLLTGTQDSTTHDHGLIGPTANDDSMEFYQYLRVFSDFQRNSALNSYNILGEPQQLVEGNDEIDYNANSALRFTNQLTLLQTDENNIDNDSHALIGVNSYGARSLLLAENNLTPLEDICSTEGLTSGLVIADITRNLTNQYGGNTFEARRRTNYITLGEYQDISNANHTVFSPGDVYVQSFRFLRISPTNLEIFNFRYTQYVEIVECVLESSIDLKNRHDASIDTWNKIFQPNTDEFHQYNTVYSQQPTLISIQDIPFTFNVINNFTNAVRASKLKLPGELIDGWTELLPNEEIQLDGKFGPGNKILSHNDNIYTFQDKAVAYLAINPRVQTVGNDGISIELGTGNVLHDYTYLTTRSGTSNRFSVVSSPSAIYYYDLINNSINSISRNAINGISDKQMIHSLLSNELVLNELKNDNIYTGGGVVSYYDDINKDVYFTFKQTNSFTLTYNEMSKSFPQRFSFVPFTYFNLNGKLVTCLNNGDVWEHFIGDRGNYYGTVYNADITLLVNPPTFDNIFNNIRYKSEVFDSNGVDLPKATLSNIKAWNNYQESNTVDLNLNSNIKRRFRTWEANIPRDSANKLDRIRSPWCFIKFTFDNSNNNELILHPIDIHYSSEQ